MGAASQQPCFFFLQLSFLSFVDHASVIVLNANVAVTPKQQLEYNVPGKPETTLDLSDISGLV